MDETINLVLFSGTDDKLQAAAIMTAGAAALGKPVNVFLQYWALRSFTKAEINEDHGLAAEAGEAGRASVDALTKAGQASWAETLRMAKELGEVSILACSGSLDVLGLDVTTLDPLVDDSGGIATFLLAAEGGQLLFI